MRSLLKAIKLAKTEWDLMEGVSHWKAVTAPKFIWRVVLGTRICIASPWVLFISYT